MPQGKVFDLGSQGDGLIENDGSIVFVPYVLPEEEVVYTLEGDGRGTVVEFIRKSTDRVEPICPYFGVCGGCVLQHAKTSFYHEMKIRWLKEAFPVSIVVPEFDIPVFIPPYSRRRVTFGFAWNPQVRWMGLNMRRSDKLLAVETCALLVPELERLIKPLRTLMMDKTLQITERKKGSGDILLQHTDAGTDILFTLPFDPDLHWRMAIADFALEAGVARVSWRMSEHDFPEPLFVGNHPILAVGDFYLEPPPGVFLQPSKEGEKALQEVVSEYLGNAIDIMDLFCGAGTFTLSLLKKGRKLYGVDNDDEALKALVLASAGRVTIEERDLFKVPMLTEELNGYSAIVFDPPRAGAKAQCMQIAASDVPVVVAVSCNPVSFVRDAEILINGGYSLQRITPVDQFVFSPHMELVALFTK